VSRRPSIPLSSFGTLSRRVRLTLVARAVLAACLIGALVAVFLLTHRDKAGESYLQAGRSPVIALDVSWSVTFDKSKLIERTLQGFIDSGRRIGLVLFSDVAYEALPVGTPSEALRPFLRFFQGRGQNPWRATFSAGTRISNALELARRMLLQAHADKGSVVLISDLDRTLVTYQREAIPLRMIAVDAVPHDVQFFRDALHSVGSVTTLAGGGGSSSSPGFPTLIVVLVGLFLLALALNEHTLGRLTWGRGRTT
jgi:VWA domain-containing protein